MPETTRLVYFPAPEKVYTPDDLREIFARFHPTDPIIAALRQIFQQRFADAAVEAANARLTEREAGHAGGRISEITSFRDEVLGYLNVREDPAAGQPTPPPPGSRRRAR